MEAVKSGFKSVKLHQIDIASVRATREAVGDDIEITIDPNGVFNSLEAEHFAKSLAKYNVGWLEEPILAAGRLQGFSSTTSSISYTDCRWRK